MAELLTGSDLLDWARKKNERALVLMADAKRQLPNAPKITHVATMASALLDKSEFEQIAVLYAELVYESAQEAPREE